MSIFAKIFGRRRIFSMIRKGKIESVKSLLKADPTLVSEKDQLGWTPLHYAIHWNVKDLAVLFLANGAEVNSRDQNGFTPLHVAVGQAFQDLAEVLIANRAEVNVPD